MKQKTEPPSETTSPKTSKVDNRRENRAEPDLTPLETPFEPDESSDLDESVLDNTDDDRWDVFILDDDCDSLPDYGDFWLPD
jgi:hypothetical protein